MNKDKIEKELDGKLNAELAWEIMEAFLSGLSTKDLSASYALQDGDIEALLRTSIVNTIRRQAEKHRTTYQ
jgi:hypothetical protein